MKHDIIFHTNQISPTLSPTGKIADLKERNISSVLYTLLTHNSISRKQIIEITGLAPSTVSGITDYLLGKGIIKRIGNLSSSTVGRKTELLARNPRASLAGSVYLTPERCQVAIVDFNYEIVEKSYIDFEDGFDESKTSEIISLLKELINNQNNRNSVHTISLALPHHPFDNWVILEAFKREFTQTIFQINNVEAMASYEYYAHLSKKLHTLIFVYIGTGIGSGLIIDGKLYKGVSGNASDLGHIYITDKPLFCRCGRRGCLETVSSELALSKNFKKHFGLNHYLKREELIKFIKEGIKRKDQYILSTLEEATFYLSRALFNLASIIDPQEIVITGRINELNPYFSNMLETAYVEHSKIDRFPLIPLSFIPLHEEAGLKGSAMYSFISLYSDPNQRKNILTRGKK